MSEPNPVSAAKTETQPGVASIACDKAILVYDGQCPFCRWYVGHLSQSLAIDTIDAREDPAMVARLASAGVDLDRDMALVTDDRTFKGAEALHQLCERNSPPNQREEWFKREGFRGGWFRGRWFNKLHRSLFGRRCLAIVVYPGLRLLRSAYLRISGRSPIQ